MATGAVTAADDEQDYEQHQDCEGGSAEHLDPEGRWRRFAACPLASTLFAHGAELTRQTVSKASACLEYAFVCAQALERHDRGAPP
jgi:hypothetical protein